MSNDDLEGAIQEFLRKTDDAYREYEQGYANADATLRKLQDYVETLGETVDTDTEE